MSYISSPTLTKQETDAVAPTGSAGISRCQRRSRWRANALRNSGAANLRRYLPQPEAPDWYKAETTSAPL
jgi:hypothetical protein